MTTKANRHFLLYVYLLLLPVNSFSQIKNIGLPFIANYSKNIYNQGTQNWCMVQDDRGFMYFANNNGILEFDGNSWQIYHVDNNSLVRSVCYADDKKIYAGAYNEFGYLEKLPNGKSVYRSLINLVPKECRNFDEVWEIYQTDFGIVFQSFYYVFIYQHGKIEVIKPFSSFGLSFYINNTYYLIDREKGIFVFRNNKLEPVVNDPSVFSESEIRFLLPYGKNQLLIGLLNKGVYVFDGSAIKLWRSQVQDYLLRNQIFSGIQLGATNYAFGSIQDGVYVTDTEGNILQHIDRTKGLQNNTVLSLFSDHSENLWLGLDNGISYIEVKSPLTYFNFCYGIETGYTSIVYKDKLYFGTNQGLFVKDLSKIKQDAGKATPFELVQGTEGQVWCLENIDGQLFCGHNNGTFIIDGNRSQKISAIRGGWTIIKPWKDKNKLIEGTYTGMILFERTSGNSWKFAGKIKGFNESSRVIYEDADGSFWMSHGYKGIYRIELNDRMDSVVKFDFFSEKDGILGKLPFNVDRIENDVIITSDSGIFEYDHKLRRFFRSEKYMNFFAPNINLNQLVTGRNGDFWYFTPQRMGVFRLLEDGTYKNIYVPFLKFDNLLVRSYEHVYVYDDSNVFIGFQEGFIHYNPLITKDYYEPFNAYIREVKLLKLNPDSVYWFSGNANESPKYINDHFSIPYRNNSISFSFAAPYFENPDKNEFRCRLKGYDSTWTQWSNRTLREYTNLHEGNYIFEVQARNIYNKESRTDRFSFVVRPPFYRSSWAYYIYILLIATAVVGNLMYFTKRIEHTRRYEKIIHERKMIAREQQYKEESVIAENEIERLKNDKLTSEIKHKNKELANSTMHLIQKNKFLTSIKNELNTLIIGHSDESQKSKVRGLMKRIDKDLNNEKYFKVFDDYFDEVHQDFLTRLKETHPDLTPKELRLCAYLRVNISTKEISTLMNISIRGVEVSRYRLRKKLNIERDVNLTDYILKF